jgi:hypothetical protein
VEELEDRLAERMEEVVSHVQASLVLDETGMTTVPALTMRPTAGQSGDWGDEDLVYPEDDFDDKGEGAGVEGDLDMDDD